MSFIIGVLLFVLFLNASFLVLLIIIQLPKKEAGIGMAFGGGAGEALFQGGAANALSKMTTKGTIVFLSLTLVVSILVSKNASDDIDDLLTVDGGQKAPALVGDTNVVSPSALSNTNELIVPTPVIGSTNQPTEIAIPPAAEAEQYENISTNAAAEASEIKQKPDAGSQETETPEETPQQ